MTDTASETPTAYRHVRVPNEPEWYERFLVALSRRGNVSGACRAAGIGRRAVYVHRRDDLAFRDAWEEAIEIAMDALEEEAWRRAVDGVSKPVFHQGSVCGEIQEYDGSLMQCLLRAHRPAKYRERNETWNFDAGKLTNEQLARIAAGENPALVIAGSGDSGAGTSTP